MSDKFYVGLDITGFENTGKYRPISRVTLIIDDSASVTAGDDSGIEISAQCPHATQAMADALLAQMKGYQYQAFTADAANLDPAAELGDGITANGVYSTLSRIDDDGRGFPNVSAPGEVAMEEEYPSAGPMTQEFNRQISETRSQITKTAEEIRLEVSNEIEGLSSSISVQLKSIRLSVSNGSDSSTITMTVGGVAVSSQQITFTGVVKFSDLAGSGTTTINGDNITTGTISANRLNLSGAITFGDLTTDFQESWNNTSSTAQSAKSTAQSAQSTAQSAQNTVNRWTYSGSTYIDGTKIMTGTVSASTLEGGSVNLLNRNGSAVGVITMTGASSSSYAIDLRSFGALRLTGQAGDVFIQSGVGVSPYLHIASDIIVGYADLRSNQSGTYSCGTSIYRWSDVYSDTSVATTSDRKMKTAVTYDMAPYETLFDRLRPTPFRYNNGTSGRTHLGMISQDVEQAMAETGLTGQDFAGFVRGEDEGGGDICLLRYAEFIPLCIDQIQKLKARVAELEGRS